MLSRVARLQPKSTHYLPYVTALGVALATHKRWVPYAASIVFRTLGPTSFRRIHSMDGAEADLGVDARNNAMHGETRLRAARLYRGQTTNFRTVGGGFAPVLTLPA